VKATLRQIAFAVCVVNSAAEAQGGSLSGRVVTDSSSIPLSGVEIVFATPLRVTRSDSRGVFRMVGLRAGTHAISFRLAGYIALNDTVLINEGEELNKEYRLARQIAELDPVMVTAIGVPISPRMRTFERRRSSGFGSFLTSVELRAKEDLTLRTLLARVPGIRFITYQNATYVALARGAGSWNAPRAIPWDPNSPRRCWVQVYLDAIRIYSPVAATRGSPDAGQAVPNIDDYRVTDLEAIEFYAGPAATPAELGGTGATCGTLVLWTREK
jgi:carboxypeptidase-like protein